MDIVVFDSLPRDEKGYLYLLCVLGSEGMKHYLTTLPDGKRLPIGKAVKNFHTKLDVGYETVKSLSSRRLIRVSTSDNTDAVDRAMERVFDDVESKRAESNQEFFAESVNEVCAELYRLTIDLEYKYRRHFYKLLANQQFMDYHIAKINGNCEQTKEALLKIFQGDFKVDMTDELKSSLRVIDAEYIHASMYDVWEFGKKNHCFAKQRNPEWDNLLMSTGYTEDQLMMIRADVMVKINASLSLMYYVVNMDHKMRTPLQIRYINAMFKLVIPIEIVSICFLEAFQMFKFHDIENAITYLSTEHHLSRVVSHDGLGFFHYLLLESPKVVEKFLPLCIMTGLVRLTWLVDRPRDPLLANHPHVVKLIEERSKQAKLVLEFLTKFRPIGSPCMYVLTCNEDPRLHYMKDRFMIGIDQPDDDPIWYTKIAQCAGIDENLLYITSSPNTGNVVTIPFKAMYNAMHPKKPRKVKAVKPKPAPPKVELEDAQIQAFGNGTKVRKEKPAAPVEVFAVKFTEMERDAVYIDIHMGRKVREPKERHYDSPTITKMSLDRFKHNAKLCLGSAYSDEIATTSYVVQHFDPQTASKAEKALRASLFAKEVVEVVALEGNLVEYVNPRKVITEAVAKEYNKHVQSLRHEYLFMVGLNTWYQTLVKPEDVHVCIFEDCLRLGMLRFYNGIMLLHQEGGQALSDDDHNANHLRNVLVHNFPDIGLIKSDYEAVIIPLGERLLRDFIGVPVVKLSKAALFPFKVLDVQPCEARTMTMTLLTKLRTYVKLLASKQDLDKNSRLLLSMHNDWNNMSPELKIWVHHARGIESALLQIGQLARIPNKFLSSKVTEFVSVCREMRNVGYHWVFDPITPELLADLIKGIPF